jgi:hypothetical protein
MPTIRIDDEVYRWLQALAKPFEDSPNSVLRRVAGMEKEPAIAGRSEQPVEAVTQRTSHHPAVLADVPSHEEVLGERLTGARLRRRWNVQVRHALYHRDGTFYENLEQFPGALFDPNGYVVFDTLERYRRSPHLRIGQKLNVPGGIASLPGYVRVGKVTPSGSGR